MELSLLVCVACDVEFVLDRRCYRGHQYCSPECAQKGREESLTRAKALYEASSKGKKNHRDRENRRRQMRKKTEGADARKLTDQSSADPGQEGTLENRGVSPMAMISAESGEDPDALATKCQGAPSETRPIVQQPEAESPVTCCCRDCGATGWITRWEVRPGSGRRGVWAVVARLGARGRQSRPLAEPDRTNRTAAGGVRSFG